MAEHLNFPWLLAETTRLGEHLGFWASWGVALAVIVLPIFIGGVIARALRMPDHAWKVMLTLFALSAGGVITVLGWPPHLGIDLSGGVILVYEVDQSKKDADNPVDMDQLIQAVMRRINPGGVMEVVVRAYGAEQIEVIVPEVDQGEVDRIQEKITNIGSLEFRILANRFDHPDLIKRGEESDDDEVRVGGKLEARWVPMDAGAEVDFFGAEQFATREVTRGNENLREILVATDPYNVTGQYLLQARAGADPNTGQNAVNFTFNSAGARLFGSLTSENLPDEAQNRKRNLAIILDGFMYSAPSINSVISTDGQIVGDFTKPEVDDLVDVLNAGRLPAALNKEPLSRLVTGPRLGQDTVLKGQRAMIVATVAVMLFMLVYYRFAGVVANVALLMNLILVLAVMITINARFTLPGLAGLILTVGMAVDANVLIFERIREEMSRGSTLRMAIRNGFARATTTIVDANLTTLITAVVLFSVGDEQLKGFAVILILGIVMSMFTAIFVARLLFDVAERKRGLTKLSMASFVGETRFDFVGWTRVAVVASVLAIVVGLVGVGMRGASLLDIDFTGGVSVEILFDEPLPGGIADVRQRTDEKNLSPEIRGEVREILQARYQQEALAEIREDLGDAASDEAVNQEFERRLDRWTSLPDVAVSSVQITDQPEGLRYLINTSNPNILGVEELLKRLFTDHPLATNNVQAEPPVAIAAAADAESENTDPENADVENTLPNTSLGADPFAGGSQTELTFSQGIGHDALEAELLKAFSLPTINQPSTRFEVTHPDYTPGSASMLDRWTVKMAVPPETAEQVAAALVESLGAEPYFPSSNSIGGSVAGNTQVNAITAIVLSLLCIVGYIWIRFQRVSYGVAAVVALVHDVLITLGVLAWSFWLADVPGLGTALLLEPFKISLAIVAAFLTIIGYSLNDTIVVFDRMREVKGKSPALTREMVNVSVNQTLSRTILTAVTTFIVVLILYVMGGQGIHGFAFCMVLGVVAGTYSSVYVAAPILLWMNPAPASANSAKGQAGSAAARNTISTS